MRPILYAKVTLVTLAVAASTIEMLTILNVRNTMSSVVKVKVKVKVKMKDIPKSDVGLEVES